jgi:hypothetical protein
VQDFFDIMALVKNKATIHVAAVQIYFNHAVKAFTQLHEKFDQSVVCKEAGEVRCAIREVIETINISAMYLNDSCGLLVLGIIDRAEQVLYWRIQLCNSSLDTLHSEDFKARFESLKLSKRYMINYFLALRSGGTRLAALWAKAVQFCDPPPLDCSSLFGMTVTFAPNNFRRLCSEGNNTIERFLKLLEGYCRSEPEEYRPILKMFISTARRMRANTVLEALACEKDPVFDTDFTQHYAFSPAKMCLQDFVDNTDSLSSFFTEIYAEIKEAFKPFIGQDTVHFSDVQLASRQLMFRLVVALGDARWRKRAISTGVLNSDAYFSLVENHIDNVLRSITMLSGQCSILHAVQKFRYLSKGIKQDLAAFFPDTTFLADFAAVELFVEQANQTVCDIFGRDLREWEGKLETWKDYDEDSDDTAAHDEQDPDITAALSLSLPQTYSPSAHETLIITDLVGKFNTLVSDMTHQTGNLLKIYRVYCEAMHLLDDRVHLNYVELHLKGMRAMLEHGFAVSGAVIAGTIVGSIQNIFDHFEEEGNEQYLQLTGYWDAASGAIKRACSLYRQTQFEKNRWNGEYMMQTLHINLHNSILDELAEDSDELQYTVERSHRYEMCILLYERYKESKQQSFTGVPLAADIWFALFYIAYFAAEGVRNLSTSHSVITSSVQFELYIIIADAMRCADEAIQQASDESCPHYSHMQEVLPHMCYVLQEVAEFARMGMDVNYHQKFMNAVKPSYRPSSIPYNAKAGYKAILEVFVNVIQVYNDKYPNTILSRAQFTAVQSFFQQKEWNDTTFGPINNDGFLLIRLKGIVRLMDDFFVHLAQPSWRENVSNGIVCSLFQIQRLSFEYALQSAVQQEFQQFVRPDVFETKSVLFVAEYSGTYRTLPVPAFGWEHTGRIAAEALRNLLFTKKRSSQDIEIMKKMLASSVESVQLHWHVMGVCHKWNTIDHFDSEMLRLLKYSRARPRNLRSVERLGNSFSETYFAFKVTYILKILHCTEVGNLEAVGHLDKALFLLNKAFSCFEFANRDKFNDHSRYAERAQKHAALAVCTCARCAAPMASSGSSSSSSNNSSNNNNNSSISGNSSSSDNGSSSGNKSDSVGNGTSSRDVVVDSSYSVHHVDNMLASKKQHAGCSVGVGDKDSALGVGVSAVDSVTADIVEISDDEKDNLSNRAAPKNADTGSNKRSSKSWWWERWW